MCNCFNKFDLEKTIILAQKMVKLLNENIVIFKNTSGYNIISEKCFKIDLGELVKTLNYE